MRELRNHRIGSALAGVLLGASGVAAVTAPARARPAARVQLQLDVRAKELSFDARITLGGAAATPARAGKRLEAGTQSHRAAPAGARGPARLVERARRFVTAARVVRRALRCVVASWWRALVGGS